MEHFRTRPLTPKKATATGLNVLMHVDEEDPLMAHSGLEFACCSGASHSDYLVAALWLAIVGGERRRRTGNS